ncbi:MAG: DUF4331 domain-containing protein [Chloroflexi bacterium]|nr:DUF4331 domain-containing protein [Chloroflexota bacterium]
MAGLSVLVVSGSSHREAPLISQDPAADTTDVYAWVDANDPTKVNLVFNVYPSQEPNGGPNFYRFSDDVLYEIKIDNDGDAKEDITYRFRFDTETMNPDTFLYNTGPITSLDDPDWNVRQTYSVVRVDSRKKLELLGSGLATPPSNIGPVSTPDYEALAAEAVHDLGNGVTVFAGQRDDPFFVDLGSIFDLLTIRPGAPGNAGGGVDGLGGFNVQTIAIQVPIAQLTAKHDKHDDEDGEEVDEAVSSIIGVWATSSRQKVRVLRKDGEAPRNNGRWVQISRLGMPLVNEVVIPLKDKDRFNASKPNKDGQFLEYVTDPEIAGLLNLLYDGVVAPIPTTGRDDLVAVFLTGIPTLNMPDGVTPSEMLRLNTAIPPSASPDRLGAMAGDFAGFPNGRRLADDVTDIVLRAAACGYGDILESALGLCNLSPNNLLGDGVDENDVPFLSEFPYVATPNSGFEHEHHPMSPGAMALGIGSGLLATGLVVGAGIAIRRRRDGSLAA